MKRQVCVSSGSANDLGCRLIRCDVCSQEHRIALFVTIQPIAFEIQTFREASHISVRTALNILSIPCSSRVIIAQNIQNFKSCTPKSVS